MRSRSRGGPASGPPRRTRGRTCSPCFRRRGVAPTTAELAERSRARPRGRRSRRGRAGGRELPLVGGAARIRSTRRRRSCKDAVRDLGVGVRGRGVRAVPRSSRSRRSSTCRRAAGARRTRCSRRESELRSSASGRLVWLWLVTGLALRRGDLELVDRHLPELRAMALASEEPQRILADGLRGDAARAARRGTASRVRELADVVLALAPGSCVRRLCLRAHDPHARSPRSTIETGSSESCRTLPGAVGGAPGSLVRGSHAGLLARLDGSLDEASRSLLEGEAELARLGRHYDAACVALEARFGGARRAATR